MRRFLGLLIVALTVSIYVTGMVWADDAGAINHGQKGVATGAPVGDIYQVTMNDYDDWEPCWGASPWSNDEQWIVYQSHREPPSIARWGGEGGLHDDYSEVCKMKSDGSEWSQLTENSVCDSHPSFVPPNHEWIVFQSKRDDVDYGGNFDDGKADIFMMGENGADVELLTKGSEFPPEPGCGCEHGYSKPVVSPDGAKIAYRTQAMLHAMNTDVDGLGKRYPRLISSGHSCDHHTWFPDSQWILYDGVWGESVGRSLYKAKMDGTQVVPLSDDNLVIAGPDGNYIDTASNTYPDGGCAGWAAKGDNWAFASPDGQFIAYHTRYGVVRMEDGKVVL